MLQSFVIVLREGFEAFLIVAVIVAYLKRTGQTQLLPAAYWGIGVSLVASVGLGFWMSQGVNEPLWEGVLGLVAAVMVTTLVIQMWRQGRYMKANIEKKLEATSKNPGKFASFGVFAFTVLMISREGMETALMLVQVPRQDVFAGVSLGILATAAFSWLWVRFSRYINLQMFFQVTGIFLLLFVAQILLYSFHEFSETGLIPNSEAFHVATEPYSPDGLYGQWFPIAMIAVCAAWLLGAWLNDLVQRKIRASAK